MKIKSSQTLVSEALQDIKTISTDEAYNLSIKDQCNLIDIRDIRELEKEGRVEKSNHIPKRYVGILVRSLIVLILKKVNLI